MTIKVISLKRTPDRLDNFCRSNSHINFEVFSAIDGKGLEKDSTAMREFFSQEINYTDGAYGCALSHIQLWIECIEKNIIITICEDDCILHNEFNNLMDKTLNKLSTEWDIFLWTWNFDSYLAIEYYSGLNPALILLDQENIKTNQREFQKSKINPQPQKLLRAFGTSCYSINPYGAKKLLQKILPLMHCEVYFPGINKYIPNNGIDIAMNREYTNMNSYVAIPPIAFSPNIRSSSTVQED